MSSTEIIEQSFNDLDQLAACDKLDPRFPAAILPHGQLFVLKAGETTVVAASENVETEFNLTLDTLFNQGLSLIFGHDLLEAVVVDALPQTKRLGRFKARSNEACYEMFAHDIEQWRILEIELCEPRNAAFLNEVDREVNVINSFGDYVEKLKSPSPPLEAAQSILKPIQELTGYDTVLYLDFLPDGSLQVIAEEANGNFPSYLDKLFPRSDIPEAARRNMLTVSMVYLPDITYTPIPLRTSVEGPDLARLDLGRANLRSLSQVCNRFYLNVGIQGKLVIPLIENGVQYASIICWNTSPRAISYTNRHLAMVLAELAGKFVREKERAEANSQMLHASKRINQFLEALSQASDYDAGLKHLPELLLKIIDACGCVVCSDEETFSAGIVPSRETLSLLAEMLKSRNSCHSICNTSCAKESCYISCSEPILLEQSSGKNAERLAGVIILPLLLTGQYMALFRREWETEVTWAGNPAKPIDIDYTTGERRLTARGSFETWRQMVQGQSRPWSPSEIDIFQSLRSGLLMVQARHIAEQASSKKSRFLADVSHEIRSPLNAIAGITRLLAMNVADEHKQMQIRKLDLAVDHMLAVVNGVLDLSKIEAGKMSLEDIDFSLTVLLESAVNIVEAKAREKGLELVIQFNDVPDRLRGDPTRLTQMLINYLVNAVKFTIRGKVSVLIDIEEVLDDSIFTRFRVVDTGVGMTSEELERLFAVFTQANDEIARAHGGTGLGLVITRRLARMMGGDAGVSSIQGEGSTFWFTCWLGKSSELSSLAAMPLELAENPVLLLQKLAMGKRILLVDDEEFNQVLGIELLGLAGLEVVTASSAEDAIEILSKQHIDMVLTDMNLSGMSGLEATRIIRANPDLSDLPIVALTGDDLDAFRIDCLAAGMNDFLIKPTKSETLYKTVLKCLIN